MYIPELHRLPSSEDSCPGNFEDWDGSSEFCYLFHDELLSWNDAENYCMGLGGHLASIHNQAENALLEKKAKEFDKDPWIGYKALSKYSTFFIAFLKISIIFHSLEFKCFL